MSKPEPAPQKRVSADVVARVVLELTRLLGNRCVTSQAVREAHANTLTWIPNQAPDAVVFPLDAGEVRQVVAIASESGVPIIPFGTGTSFEGHVNAPQGGISIDTSMMKAIKAVHPEDLDCVVEPGVTRKMLNEHLRSYGLFFPVDPGADASIGGMTATRASGTNAVRYGTMKDNVIALKAVLANGETLTTAQRAKKTSAGYDLTRLFVGSEGTLGVITEITLRLQALPEAVSAGNCAFPSIRHACDAAIATIQSGIPVARVELMDALQVKACNAYSKLSLPESPTLFLEFHGTEAGVAEQSERFGEIAAEYGGGAFEWATRPEDRSRLWQARHDAYWAATVLKPGLANLSTDVCVPISHLAACVEETRADIDAGGFTAAIVGHVGDGNFHVLFLFDKSDPAEVARLEAILERLVQRAIAMEGTCTGEHGVGQGKMKYLEAELGPAALVAMRAVKQALDPKNIMNPGKIVMLSS